MGKIISLGLAVTLVGVPVVVVVNDGGVGIVWSRRHSGDFARLPVLDHSHSGVC